MDFKCGVEFDPGYSKYLKSFASEMEYVKNVLKNLKNQNMRKFQFASLKDKIKDLYHENVAFYLGCLLWASYIKFAHPNKEVLNNHSLGLTFDKNEFLYEVDYLLDYFNQFPKDCLYYLGVSDNFEQNCLKILTIYKDFLILNNGLTNVKNVDDIILSEKINKIEDKELDNVLSVIENVVNTGIVSKLYDIEYTII